VSDEGGAIEKIGGFASAARTTWWQVLPKCGQFGESLAEGFSFPYDSYVLPHQGLDLVDKRFGRIKRLSSAI
jgi:hypothetical protein